MSVDWGQALMAGFGAGATAYGNQAMAQQNAADDDERWLKRQQQMQASQAEAQKARERYLLAISPPQTDKISVAKDGKPMVQNREWIPPTDDDIAAGRKGSFKVVSEVPDINFERLEETQRNNEERNRLSSERLDMQGQYNEARIEAARARLEAQQARGGEKATKGQLVQRIDREGRSVYGTVSNGQFIPVRDEMGGVLRSQAWKPEVPKSSWSTGGEQSKPQEQVEVEVVDPADFRAPMSQFSGPKSAPAAKTASAGSSPANPIEYQPGMPKPPSGTYVRKPDGTVVRVP